MGGLESSSGFTCPSLRSKSTLNWSFQMLGLLQHDLAIATHYSDFNMYAKYTTETSVTLTMQPSYLAWVISFKMNKLEPFSGQYKLGYFNPYCTLLEPFDICTRSCQLLRFAHRQLYTGTSHVFVLLAISVRTDQKWREHLDANLAEPCTTGSDKGHGSSQTPRRLQGLGSERRRSLMQSLTIQNQYLM